jgi:hypothetical protein
LVFQTVRRVAFALHPGLTRGVSTTGDKDWRFFFSTGVKY